MISLHVWVGYSTDIRSFVLLPGKDQRFSRMDSYYPETWFMTVGATFLRRK